jgi:hypothetical protein
VDKTGNNGNTLLPVEIHENANLDRIAMHLWNDARYVPTISELREAVGRLTPNRREIFIKKMRLELPGVQLPTTYAELARERGTREGPIRVAFREASQQVDQYLYPVRQRRLNR